MIAYSASDAISPAIERTKRFLFQPFHFWTFLKLCLVAVLTDGGGSSFNSHFPSGTHNHSQTFVENHATFSNATFVTTSSSTTSWPTLPPLDSAIGFFVLIPAIALGIALMLWIWYLLVRLRFAYFHCLTYQTRLISPGWRLYAEPAMRFFKLQLVVALLALVAIALVAGPFFFLFQSVNHSGDAPQAAAVLLAVLIGIPLLLAFIFFSIAYEIITHDFMLPRMALENATVGEAWRASQQDYRAAKGDFWLYGLLRILLAMVAGIAAIVILIVPIIFVALFVAFFATLKTDVAASGDLLLMVIEAALATIGVLLFVALLLAVGGPIATWKRQYALIFYGGRYGALGNLISPPPPPPPAPVQAPVFG